MISLDQKWISASCLPSSVDIGDIVDKVETGYISTFFRGHGHILENSQTFGVRRVLSLSRGSYKFQRISKLKDFLIGLWEEFYFCIIKP